jgi:hypothetical protein
VTHGAISALKVCGTDQFLTAKPVGAFLIVRNRLFYNFPGFKKHQCDCMVIKLFYNVGPKVYRGAVGKGSTFSKQNVEVRSNVQNWKSSVMLSEDTASLKS